MANWINEKAEWVFTVEGNLENGKCFDFDLIAVGENEEYAIKSVYDYVKENKINLFSIIPKGIR